MRWEEAENELKDEKSPQHSKETFLRGAGKKQNQVFPGGLHTRGAHRLCATKKDIKPHR